MDANYFTLSLKNYLEAYKPELVNDEQFINTRGAQALDCFRNYSHLGFSVEECLDLSIAVLYADLETSRWMVLEQLADEYYKDKITKDELRVIYLSEEYQQIYQIHNPDEYKIVGAITLLLNEKFGKA